MDIAGNVPQALTRFSSEDLNPEWRLAVSSRRGNRPALLVQCER